MGPGGRQGDWRLGQCFSPRPLSCPVLLLSGGTGQQVRSGGQPGVQLQAEEQVRVAPYHSSCHLFAQDSERSQGQLTIVKQNPSTNFIEVGFQGNHS